MKLQLQEQDKTLSNLNYFKNIVIPIVIGITMFFASCERNNIERINELTSELNSPSISVTNTEITYSKNALIEARITSKQINRYVDIEEPYMEFPEGLFVEFYDSIQNVTSYIKANYCIYDETTKIWTAENDVESVSDKGDTLNTEYLVWDEQKQKIYSDRYVRITNEDGIIHGVGFEADQDLTNWRIKKTSGTISVENEK